MSNKGLIESDNYRWAILALLTLAQLVMSLGAYAWGPLAPFLRLEFDISRSQIGLIVSSLYLGSVIIAIPSGIAVDKLGTRLILIFALILMGTSFLFLSIVNLFIVFIIIVAISGLSYGMINQISTKSLMQWFQNKGRATAISIKQTGVTLGGAIGGLMLPALAIGFSWRWALVSTGLMMLFVGLITLLGYREQNNNSISDNKAAQYGASYNYKKIKQILLNKKTILFCVVGFLLAFAHTSIASFFVLYLNEKLNISTKIAGGCLTILMIAGTIGRIAWGVISDQVFNGNRQIPLIVLCFIASVSILGLAFLSEQPLLWHCYLLCIVIGFTFMGWQGLYLALGAEISGPNLAGSFTGFILTINWIGIIIGPFTFGIIADHISYFCGWLMLSLFSLIAASCFILSISSGKNSNKERG